jgi:hypothetical protein
MSAPERRTRTPSWFNPFTMNAESSLSDAFRIVDSPCASAAQTRARFVKLFEPGTRKTPSTGPPVRISLIIK